MNRKKNLYQKVLMDCEEATMLSTKMVYKEKVSFMQKLRFWLHKLTCPPCDKFHADNKKLDKILIQEDLIPKLDTKTKSRIHDKVEAEK